MIQFLMVGTIFNPAKVNTVPCMFTATLSLSLSLSLSQLASIWPDSVAYIIINSIVKTTNRVKSANYHLNKLLSASAWSSLSSLIISAKSSAWFLTFNVLSPHLQGKQLPSILTKLLTSTCTFPFQNLSSHYVVGIRLFNLAPVRNM